MTSPATDPASDGPRVSATQVAELAGVGAWAVSNWRKRFPDFPRPVGASPGGGDLFLLSEVEAWLRGRNRPVRRRSDFQQSNSGRSFGTYPRARTPRGARRSSSRVLVPCSSSSRELDLPLATDTTGAGGSGAGGTSGTLFASVAKTRPDAARALEPLAELDADGGPRLLMDTLTNSTREVAALSIDVLLTRASRYSEFRTDPDYATLPPDFAKPRGQSLRSSCRFGRASPRRPLMGRRRRPRALPAKS